MTSTTFAHDLISTPLRSWHWVVGGIFLLISCQGPALTEPPISLAAYEVPEGYQLQVVASEPLIHAPVAMDIDHRGRIWVVEMNGYMSDLNASEEDAPNGRIVILSDQDGNGRMDQAEVFLDSLVLPRALRLFQRGLLYAEPPNLWWVEISLDGQPGERVLVDSTYAMAGNVEHQPNGLLINLDNWIYNAKSNLRYRYHRGQWKRGFTAKRGQWGISHDDQGRLFTNLNSTLLLGDQALPQATLQHPFFRPTRSLLQRIPTHQHLYPAHATLVNRGYQPYTLDSVGRLKRPSAACGALIFRGDGLMSQDDGQAFVCIPEANLIKRLALVETEGVIQAINPDLGPEFLSSIDPLFRPVNLNNGPDGALYIVDMHRGVIQHQAYMTSYLRDNITQAQMDTAIHQGRILAVRRANHRPDNVFDWQTATSSELLATLSHPNGWRRDKAQQELVYRQDREVIAELRRILRQGKGVGSLHAFWTLEGMDALDAATYQMALDHPWSVVNQAGLYVLALADTIPDDLRWQHLLTNQDPATDRYLALALPRLLQNESVLHRHWAALAGRNPNDSLLPEFAISGWGAYAPPEPDTPAHFTPVSWQEAFLTAQQAEAANKPNLDMVYVRQQTDNRTKGLALFQQYCSSCHGTDGHGQAHLAPSLHGSTYVGGPVERLGFILLYGLQGPLHQSEGKTVEFAGIMPAFGANPDLSNKDLTHLMAYVRSAFSQAPIGVESGIVDSLRNVDWPSGNALTEEDLHRLVPVGK